MASLVNSGSFIYEVLPPLPQKNEGHLGLPDLAPTSVSLIPEAATSDSNSVIHIGQFNTPIPQTPSLVEATDKVGPHETGGAANISSSISVELASLVNYIATEASLEAHIDKPHQFQTCDSHSHTILANSVDTILTSQNADDTLTNETRLTRHHTTSISNLTSSLNVPHAEPYTSPTDSQLPQCQSDNIDSDPYDVSDSEIFHGYNFEVCAVNRPYTSIPTQETLCAPHPQNPLGSFDKALNAQEERQILKKYTKFGVLSTFKGTREMSLLKEKAIAKKEIWRLRELMKQQENKVEELKSALRDAQEKRQQSCIDLDKIAIEMEQIIQDTCTISTNIPKHIQIEAIHAHSSAIVSVQNSGQPHSEPDGVFPTDPRLIFNKRYQMLREHYCQHRDCILSANHLSLEIQASLVLTLHDLSGLASFQRKLLPLEEEFAKSDMQELIEMQVISKHRMLKKKQRIEQQIKRNELADREKAESHLHEIEDTKLLLEKRAQSNELMHVRLVETKLRIETERISQKQHSQEKQLKKEQALHALSKRIEKIRCNIKINNHCQPNTNYSLEESEKNTLIKPNRPESIRIAIDKLTKRQTHQLEKKKKLQENQEERKMRIIEKLILEEEKRHYQEKVIRKKRKNLGSLKENASFPIRASLLGVVNPKEITQDPIAPSIAISRLSLKSYSEVDVISDSEISSCSSQKNGNSKKSFNKDIESTFPIQLQADCDTTTDKSHHPSATLAIQKPEIAIHLPPPQIKNYKPKPLGLHLPLSASSFCASPATYIFRDYNPEQAYSTQITITNVSGRINSFKLLSIPIEISNLFDVQFSPPGKLCAGASCIVNILFCPPHGFSEDIPLQYITFKAEVGGAFVIAVGCCRQVCCPVIASVSGDRHTKKVTFHSKARKSELRSDALISNLDLIVDPIPTELQKQPIAIMAGDNSLSLNLGACVVGGQRSVCINLANLGAISVRYQLLCAKAYYDRIKNSVPTESGDFLDKSFEKCDISSPNLASSNTDDKESLIPASFDTTWLQTDGLFQARGSKNLLNKYDSHMINIDFNPPYVSKPYTENSEIRSSSFNILGSSELCGDFVIDFDNNDVKPIFLSCKAISTPAQIVINRDLLDYKICVVDNIYRDKVMIRNHSNIALKFWIEFDGSHPRHIPDSKSVRVQGLGDIEVSPSMAFAQPSESFIVWFTIKPLLDMCDKQLDSSGISTFEVTLLVKYIDNNTHTERSIPFRLVGTLTSNQIRLEAKNGDRLLDFGPRESVTRMVKFEPTMNAVHDFKLVCQSTWSQRFEIRCCGIGVTPLAQFEYSQIDFSPCVWGDKRQTRIRLISNHIRDKASATQRDNETCPSAHVGLRQATERVSDKEDITFQFGAPIVVRLHEQHESFIPSSNQSQEDLCSLEKDATCIPNHSISGSVSHTFTAANSIDCLLSDDPLSKLKTAAPSNSKGINQEIESHALKKENEVQSSASLDQLTIDNNKQYILTPQDPQILSIWPPSGKLLPKKPTSIEITLSPPFLNPKGIAPKKDDTPIPIQAPPQIGQVAKPLGGTIGLPVESTTLSKSKNSDSDRMIKKGKDYHAILNELYPTKVDFSALLMGFPPSDPVANTVDSLNPTLTALESEGTSMIYLKIIAPISQPDFVLVEPVHGDMCDLGIVPLGERSYRDISVRNTFTEPITLKWGNLSPMGPFRVVNCLRRFDPGETRVLRVAFEPEESSKFSATLEMVSERSQLTCRLYGEGLIPTISINPMNQCISMDDVCVGDTAIRTLKITNTSVILMALSYSVSSVSDVLDYKSTDMHDTIESHESPLLCHGTVNRSGTNPFSISPICCTLAPGATQDIIVKFTPDRESDMFFDHIRISYAGQTELEYVSVQGKAWEATTAVLGYDQRPCGAREKKGALDQRSALQLTHQRLSGDDGESFQGPLAISDEVSKASEGLSSDMMRHVDHKGYRFITITLPWKKVIVNGSFPEKYVWRIESHDITLANLKPTSTKTNFGKRSPTAEFSIERYSGSFRFDANLNEYVVCCAPCTTHSESPVAFGLEPVKGTVELGQTKALKVIVNDPARESYDSLIKTAEQCTEPNVEGSKESPASASNITPNMSSTSALREKALTPRTAIQSKVAITPDKKDQDSRRIQRLKKLVQNSVGPQDPAEIVDGGEENNIPQLHCKDLKSEISEPSHVESVYKISMSGGCRLVEPKGILNLSEPRIWLVKIQATACPIE
ncbi:hypothetical protein BASA60_001380 [Batrachochytrium salamandrivorans]|nr:hypothetical protein BASA60_001380 [Batrachochytrium salamandrivorans]